MSVGRRRLGRRVAPDIPIPVSPGELVDRIARLELALSRPGRPSPERAVAAARLAALRAARDASLPATEAFDALADEMSELNADLEALRDDLAAAEEIGAFGPAFVALARSEQTLRRRREALRREIDALFETARG